MDDDAALSAANLTQEVNDDYEEEGFDQLQLLDRPWTLPLPNQPSDPIEPVLRMHTRRQRALAGEIEFPPLQRQTLSRVQTELQRGSGARCAALVQLMPKGEDNSVQEESKMYSVGRPTIPTIL